MLDELHPFDMRVFGCLKAIARAEDRRFSLNHPIEKGHTQDPASLLVDSWDRLLNAAMEAG
jgi:hypothetical protein